MIQSVKAIVRGTIPEYPALKPGTLVLISHWALAPEDRHRRFPATLPSQPAPVHWLAPEMLLPYSKFLRRQPSAEFWMLAVKERLLSQDADAFLSDPIKQRLGPKGFRFESLGEVVYFLRHHQLNAQKFKICHVCDVALE